MSESERLTPEQIKQQMGGDEYFIRKGDSVENLNAEISLRGKFITDLLAHDEQLRAELKAAQEAHKYCADDLKQWDGACAYCANPDIDDPWRHEHEIGGKGNIGHWHHCIDPGDGLADPCKNSDRLERVFQELQSQLKTAEERLALACELLSGYMKEGFLRDEQVEQFLKSLTEGGE